MLRLANLIINDSNAISTLLFTDRIIDSNTAVKSTGTKFNVTCVIPFNYVVIIGCFVAS